MTQRPGPDAPSPSPRTSPLARGTGVALWRQISEGLRAEIASGTFEPGDRLPTEMALADRFAVNRHTIRRAIAALAEDGLVTITQGRGTFVTEDVIDYHVTERTRFSVNMERQQRRSGATLLGIDRVAAGPPFVELLGLSAGAPVLRISRLTLADNRPMAVARHHFDAARFPDLGTAYEEAGSITRALEACGVPDYRRRRTRVITSLPSAEDARLLRQAPSKPVLITEALNVDPSDAPLEVSVTSYAGQRVQLVFDY